MIKVKIDYVGKLEYFTFDTELPKIPEKSDLIGFWHTDSEGNNEWVLSTIVNIVYEIHQNKSFHQIEMIVTS